MNMNDSSDEEKPEEPLPENKKRYSDMKNEHYKEIVRSKHNYTKAPSFSYPHKSNQLIINPNPRCSHSLPRSSLKI